MSYQKLFDKWRSFLTEQAPPPQDVTGITGARPLSAKDIKSLPGSISAFMGLDDKQREAERKKKAEEERRKKAEEEKKRREEEAEAEEGSSDSGEINGGKPLIILPGSRVYASYKLDENVEPGIVNSVQIHELLPEFEPLPGGLLRKNCGWGHPMTADVVKDAHEHTKAFKDEGAPNPKVGNISRKNGGPLWRNDQLQYYFKDIPKTVKNTEKNGRKRKVTTYNKWTEEQVNSLNLPKSLIGKKSGVPTFSTSHQQGLDIDLGFYQKSEKNWITYDTKQKFLDQFDLDRNIAFIYKLCEDSRVHRIFFDNKVIAWMDEAVNAGAFNAFPGSFRPPLLQMPGASGSDESGDFEGLAEQVSIEDRGANGLVRWWDGKYDDELSKLANENGIKLPEILFGKHYKMGDVDGDNIQKDGQVANRWFAQVDGDTPRILNVRAVAPRAFSKLVIDLVSHLKDESESGFTWMLASGRALSAHGTETQKEILPQIIEKLEAGFKTLKDPSDTGVAAEEPAQTASEEKKLTVTKMWLEIRKCGKLRHQSGHNNHYHIRLAIGKVKWMRHAKFKKEYKSIPKEKKVDKAEEVKVSKLVTSKTFIENSKFKDQFGFVFGTIDGKILHEHNANKRFKGASMQKLLAIIYNFAQARQKIGRKLTDKEQQNLIAYQKHGGEGVKGYDKKTKTSKPYTIKTGDSNYVMRKLYGNLSSSSNCSLFFSLGCFFVLLRFLKLL